MSAGFDRLARWYRVLEYLAFGNSLERARRRHLPALARCRHILVLGEGDGRCLRELSLLAPDAHIRVVDGSAAMLERARQLLPPDAIARVTFEQGDVRTLSLPIGAYDAVVTLFILDCFDPPEAAHVVSRVRTSLCPGALWAFADFVLPPSGWRRWRATIWIRGLYFFFGLATGLAVSSLPPSEALIETAGARPISIASYQGDMIHSVLFEV
jgi:ubiquinone/menaquinone biosynthesis C-methylase UbiE